MRYYEEYYNLLGIDENTSLKEGQRAYMRLVKLNKPESNPEKFQEITQAWNTLKNLLPKDPPKTEAQPAEHSSEIQIQIHSQEELSAARRELVIESPPKPEPKVDLISTIEFVPISITSSEIPKNIEIEVTKKSESIPVTLLISMESDAKHWGSVGFATHSWIMKEFEKHMGPHILYFEILLCLAIRAFSFNQLNYLAQYEKLLLKCKAILAFENIYFANLLEKKRLFEIFKNEDMPKIPKQFVGALIFFDFDRNRMRGLSVPGQIITNSTILIRNVELLKLVNTFVGQFITVKNQNPQIQPVPSKKGMPVWLIVFFIFLGIRLIAFLAGKH